MSQLALSITMCNGVVQAYDRQKTLDCLLSFLGVSMLWCDTALL
jgi:hypothetical protein